VALRSGFILCVAAICALAVGAGHARADASPPPPTIADGVLIGSVAVGGMTADEATAAVDQVYLAPVVLRVAHRSYSVELRRFHTFVPVAAAVQTALTAAPDTTVPLVPTLDTTLVTKFVVKLAQHTDRAPIAGRLLLRHDRPFFTTARAGWALEKLATRMLIRDAIRSGARTPVVAPLRKLTAARVKAEPIIVIHRGLNRLVLFNGTRVVRSFPVATGQAIYPTPLGHFEIVVKELNPWWYPPTQDAWAKGLKPVPPGPGNPLGTRWMGLSAPGVGIHGTDEPWSIGHSESHGCVRMQVPDAEWLYNRVQVGTPVFIVAS
jgi:lipoprotein-anchoring transpeptidase ErfK/SrfK